MTIGMQKIKNYLWEKELPILGNITFSKLASILLWSSLLHYLFIPFFFVNYLDPIIKDFIEISPLILTIFRNFLVDRNTLTPEGSICKIEINDKDTINKIVNKMENPSGNPSGGSSSNPSGGSSGGNLSGDNNNPLVSTPLSENEVNKIRIDSQFDRLQTENNSDSYKSRISYIESSVSSHPNWSRLPNSFKNQLLADYEKLYKDFDPAKKNNLVMKEMARRLVDESIAREIRITRLNLNDIDIKFNRPLVSRSPLEKEVARLRGRYPSAFLSKNNPGQTRAIFILSLGKKDP